MLLCSVYNEIKFNNQLMATIDSVCIPSRVDTTLMYQGMHSS